MALIIAAALVFSGCGGGAKLEPKELENYVSSTLKAPPQNVEVTTHFRTTVVLKLSHLDLSSARQAEEDLINACVEYFHRDNIDDFLNDTLVFVVSSSLDPGQNLKWRSVAGDMRNLVKGEMNTEEFFERCVKEENWVEDYEYE